MDNKKEIDKQNIQTREILGDISKHIPHYCTAVNFSVLNNEKLIMTFTFKEGNSPDLLISRVIVDMEHAKNINKVLSDVISKNKKNVESKSSK